MRLSQLQVGKALRLASDSEEVSCAHNRGEDDQKLKNVDKVALVPANERFASPGEHAGRHNGVSCRRNE